MRAEGLEPPRLAPPEPKSGVSANSTTPAPGGREPAEVAHGGAEGKGNAGLAFCFPCRRPRLRAGGVRRAVLADFAPVHKLGRLSLFRPRRGLINPLHTWLPRNKVVSASKCGKPSMFSNLVGEASPAPAAFGVADRLIDISIVVPVYNEEESLVPLYRMVAGALELIPRSAEIVFCDDGSTDGSAVVLDSLVANDPRIRVVHLRRNYGQTAALMAAIRYSKGAVIVAMDADCQNDPADISRLLAKLDEEFDVVSGWRKDREDKTLSRKLPSMIANRLISGLLGVPLHDYGCTLKAYRREVIADVRLSGEMHRFIPIYASWEGARVTELPVLHHARRVRPFEIRPRTGRAGDAGPADPVLPGSRA